MNGKRKVLGRGINNLIPTRPDDDAAMNDEIQNVDLNAIDTNPYQPRVDFDDAEIAGLAESIRNQGLLQPVVLRKRGDRYEIISGERRFRAFKSLKRDSVPCVVKTDVGDKEMLELALVENIQREQLNEIEKAAAYKKLIDEFNYTHDALAKQVGKSRASVTNSLRLLNLPDEIQRMVRKGEISSGHARALLSLDNDDARIDAARKIVSDKLTVRDVEMLSQTDKAVDNNDADNAGQDGGEVVIEISHDDNAAGSSDNERHGHDVQEDEEPLDPDVASAIEKLQYKFGTSVKLKSSSGGKGRLTIDYFSAEDLARIFDLLLRE